MNFQDACESAYKKGFSDGYKKAIEDMRKILTTKINEKEK